MYIPLDKATRTLIIIAVVSSFGIDRNCEVTPVNFHNILLLIAPHKYSKHTLIASIFEASIRPTVNEQNEQKYANGTPIDLQYASPNFH